MYKVWSYFCGVLLLLVLHLAIMPLAFFNRRFTHQFLLMPVCSFFLRALGIRVQEWNRPAVLRQEAVYIANHTSTLDIFVYNDLRIPRCRFFMAGYDMSVAAIYFPAVALGVFLTASQKDTEKRRQIFAKASEALAKSGDNVFLTPEGQRVLTQTIGAFNKGAFHLAISLKRPIVPLFIEIEKRIDPGVGLDTKPGNVNVYWGEAISDLPTAFDGSREIPKKFENWYQEFNQFLKLKSSPLSPANPFYKISLRELESPQAK